MSLNPVIKKQLDELKFAKIQVISEDQTRIFIPKDDSMYKQINMKVGDKYLFKLDDYLLNSYESSTLHTNWNSGVVPKSQYLNGMITDKISNMIKIDAVGFDIKNDITKSDAYLGLWVPIQSITIVKSYQ